MGKFSRQSRVKISGVLVLIAFVLNKLDVNVFLWSYYYYKDYGVVLTLPNVLMIISSAVAGVSIIKNAWGALRYKMISIEALVSIAVIGAIIIGEYSEAAAVTFLFILGEYLESKTIDKTRQSIKSLLELSPTTVRVIRDNKEIILEPTEVSLDDLVVVRPGEKIAIDGVITSGNAYINQSAITGESIPVFKQENDFVYSGTIIESGYLIIEAKRVGEDTTFAKILEMVEEAQDKKAKSQKFLERFSQYYTPAIIILSILFLVFTRDLRLALTLLVIACPGALVISTPVSIVAGIGNGAKQGILFKGGETIEQMAKVEVIAFDKTGTLTLGKPQVNKIKNFKYTADEVLRLAAIGESYSEHPLALAIVSNAKEKIGEIIDKPDNADIIIGQGIRYTYQNIEYFIGNIRFLNDGVKVSNDIINYIKSEEEQGQTVIVLLEEKEIIGVISIADTIREETQDLIHYLKKDNKQVMMLTGDNQRVAKYISKDLGIDRFYAELLPDDKSTIIEEIQATGKKVAMVGDGINDAIALAKADLGIAMGLAGADVAIEVADVVLMSDDIYKLDHSLSLSKATVRNIKQNVFFALFVSFSLLLGVILKKVDLALGMLIHEISVIIVLLNAVRLLRYKPRK